MKKTLHPILGIVLGIGSFFAGYLYNSAHHEKDPPGKTLIQGEESDNVDSLSLATGAVKITPDRQQIIGVKVSTVQKNTEVHTLRTLGRVSADESRIYRLNAALDGWIREASPNSTGSLVRKDEILGSYYAPEFLGAQQAYLYALDALDRFKATGKETPEQLSLTKANIQQYKDSLFNLGMSDFQIEAIRRTRRYTENIGIVSPVAGFILNRNISPGQRFERGTEWFRIADLKIVWILADVFEQEAKHFKPGAKAKITLPHQIETFQGTISQVLPVFDGATRTLKVRIETENPGFLLRPDMFVDVELPIHLPEAITVPADAILDSGLKKTVFVDQGNGYFEPREVEAGLRMGNRVEIVRGLEAGERIVTSGTFLIDSESKLQLAAQGMYTTLSKDPLCGADVSQVKAEKADRKIVYQGKTYYFDSDECKKKFQEDPAQYLKQ
jgi:membrane fusion protein, copper/silver efflux system